MLKSVYDTNNNGIVDNAEKVNNHTVLTDVPANALFTDTIYDDTNIVNSLNNKVDKITGKGLSTNDFTTTLKDKLDGIASGAEVNTIQSISVNGTPQTIDVNRNIDISLSGLGVTGVKGDNESTYRTGNVNITKSNIGLGNVDNTADVNKAVDSATKDGDGNVIKDTYLKLTGGTVDGTLKAKFFTPTFYTLDLSSLSTSNFYPITFPKDETDIPVDCEIHSPNLSGSAAYNQNVIHFRLLTGGWNDTPHLFNIYEYGVFVTTEITIGCIAISNDRVGTKREGECIWLRGGMEYRFLSNFEPVLHSTSYSPDTGVTYSVGTNYYGGTNSGVSIIFTPNTTLSGNGGYFNGKAKTADTATSATDAQYLKAPAEAGFNSDQYGNFKHKRSNTEDNWQFQNSAGTVKAQYFWEAGTWKANVTKLETIDGRITNANITHTNENNKAHLQLLISSGLMTSNKPAGGGYILHHSWDGNAKCDAQLYIPEGSQRVPLQYRGADDNGSWSSWENLYRCKNLYNNTSGTTATITLSETSANFTFLDIYYKNVNGEGYGSIRVYSPNGKLIDIANIESNSTLYVKMATLSCSGTSLSFSANHEWYYGGSINHNSGNYILIVRVDGYR